jgi:hypothetical protein
MNRPFKANQIPNQRAKLSAPALPNDTCNKLEHHFQVFDPERLKFSVLVAPIYGELIQKNTSILWGYLIISVMTVCGVTLCM